MSCRQSIFFELKLQLEYSLYMYFFVNSFSDFFCSFQTYIYVYLFCIFINIFCSIYTTLLYFLKKSLVAYDIILFSIHLMVCYTMVFSSIFKQKAVISSVARDLNLFLIYFYMQHFLKNLKWCTDFSWHGILCVPKKFCLWYWLNTF